MLEVVVARGSRSRAAIVAVGMAVMVGATAGSTAGRGTIAAMLDGVDYGKENNNSPHYRQPMDSGGTRDEYECCEKVEKLINKKGRASWGQQQAPINGNSAPCQEHSAMVAEGSHSPPPWFTERKKAMQFVNQPKTCLERLRNRWVAYCIFTLLK
jgi:hypothetical protein